MEIKNIKEGMRVRLKKHAYDSVENLEIGAIGTVMCSDGSDTYNVLVVWDTYENSSDWWVNNNCLSPASISLENK